MSLGKKPTADNPRATESEVAGVATPADARTAMPAPTPAKSGARQVLTCLLYTSRCV